MSEILSEESFENLSHSIWLLAKASMADVIEYAPAPSTIKTCEGYDVVFLEPEVLFEGTDSFDTKIPRILGVSISEEDCFAANPDVYLYTWRKVLLHTQSKKCDYSTGVTMQGTSGTIITPELTLPATGVHRSRGNAEWRGIKQGSNLQRLDDDTVKEFMRLCLLTRESILDR